MLSRVSVRAYSNSAVKLVTREAPGSLSTVSVVVNNAGSKAGKSGIAHLLAKHSFLNTETKSALRFTRESELLGGSFSSTVTRDALILRTQFLREDLPYYVEALGNVLTRTSFRPHELPEIVLPTAKAEYQAAHKSNAFQALESLHELSFRKGLGNPLYYDGVTAISLEEISQFASEVFTAGNVSVVASGVNESDLSGFIAETGLGHLTGGASAAAPVNSFKGKESRIRAAGHSVAVIGVPVSKADFAKYEVLSAALGTSSLPGADTPLAKIPGASSQLYKYQDAGLFVVSVSGDASAVAQGIKAAKKAVDAVSAADLSKAVKAAKLSVALQDSFEFPHNVTVDDASAKNAIKVGTDFNYVAVGNTDVLPYASEL